MGTVIMHNVMSVDGFIADENDDVGPLHEWYFSGDTPITEGGDQAYDHSGVRSGFKVSSASAKYVRPMWESIGAIVMGRTLFDLVNGWEGKPPAGGHVVVVSHRPKPEGWHPEASYHFVDDVTAAIDKAQPSWRRVVATSVQMGFPIPVFSAALSYYDGYRNARLPANLLQAQRDYFGAHTYERIDQPRGQMSHTDWIRERKLT